MAFESLSDPQIERLLKMPKRVSNPAARMVLDANHDKRDYIVQSLDGSENFKIFVRQNKTVADDFSCGLMWVSPGGESMILTRYNGSSHEHPNKLEKQTISFDCHIHLATERYIKASMKPESYATRTSAYKTCEGALHALVTDCGITGIQTNPDHPEFHFGQPGT
jgi:hypothetical protein